MRKFGLFPRPPLYRAEIVAVERQAVWRGKTEVRKLKPGKLRMPGLVIRSTREDTFQRVQTWAAPG